MHWQFPVTLPTLNLPWHTCHGWPGVKTRIIPLPRICPALSVVVDWVLKLQWYIFTLPWRRWTSRRRCQRWWRRKRWTGTRRWRRWSWWWRGSQWLDGQLAWTTPRSCTLHTVWPMFPEFLQKSGSLASRSTMTWSRLSWMWSVRHKVRHFDQMRQQQQRQQEMKTLQYLI